MKNYYELHRINILVKLFTQETDVQTRGIYDSVFKLYACYLAKKFTPYSDREIAGFFSINRQYMLKRLHELSVELMAHDDIKQSMNWLEKSVKELEAVYAQS